MTWAAFYGGVVTAATTLLTVLAAAAVLLPGERRTVLARASLTSSLAGLAVAALVSLAQLAPRVEYRTAASIVVAMLGLATILVEVGVAAWTTAARPVRPRLTSGERWWLLAGIPTAAAYVWIAAGAAAPETVSVPVLYLLVSGTIESLFTSPVRRAAPDDEPTGR